MARNSEFPENGRGPEFAGGGTSDDTQCSPLPKACQIKRPRESDGDTVMVDAVEPIRKKAATTMLVRAIGSEFAVVRRLAVLCSVHGDGAGEEGRCACWWDLVSV